MASGLLQLGKSNRLGTCAAIKDCVCPKKRLAQRWTFKSLLSHQISTPGSPLKVMANKAPLQEKERLQTCFWKDISASSRPLATPHSRMRQSFEATSTCLPSGEKHYNGKTAASENRICHTKSWTFRPKLSKVRMTLRNSRSNK